MTNIISMISQPGETIQEIRNYAREMEEYFSHVRKCATAAQDRVHRARTIEKVVYSYARYLGQYHGISISAYLAAHALPADEALTKRHADAVDAVRAAAARIDHEISMKIPWIHLPNLNRTRWGMGATLFRIIKSADAGLESCLILKGFDPDERKSA